MVLSQVRKPIESYGIDPSSFTLVNLMERVLDRVVGLYEQAGVPIPPRQFWMMGPDVPEDCEQVVVTFAQSYLGLPGDQAANSQSCNGPRTAVINVLVTRNFPIGKLGNANTPEDIMNASKWAAVDVDVLSWGLNEIASLEGMPGPSVIATVNVNPPSGGVQTTVLNLSMALM